MTDPIQARMERERVEYQGRKDNIGGEAVNSTRELYAKAIGLWGEEFQMLQAAEECAELIVAVHHVLRDRQGSREKLVEEIADVEIMMEQLRMIVGSNLVRDMRTEKLIRLQKLIEGA